MSASGQFQTALGGANSASTTIYISSNFGKTWTASSSGSYQWQSIAMSASGQYQIAGTSGSSVWYSSNYGQTWTVSTGLSIYTGGQFWKVSMSASGQYATMAEFGTGFWYSTTYGQTWTLCTSLPSGASYSTTVAMSASGQYVIGGAGSTNSQSLYYSTNYGITWTVVPSSPGGNWYGIAMSSNGQYLLSANTAGSVLYQSITANPPQNIIAQNTATTTGLTVLGPNLTTTNNVGIVLGRTITSNNYATIGFNYIGAGSTSNYLYLGTTTSTTLCITAAGNVGIGTTAPNAPLTVIGNTNLGSGSTSITTIAGTLNQTSGQSGGPYTYQSQWDTASSSAHTVTFISQLSSYTGGPYSAVSLFNNTIGIMTIYVRNTAFTGYYMTQYFVSHPYSSPTVATEITTMRYSAGVALSITTSFDGINTGNIYVSTGNSSNIQVSWTFVAAT
jgi:hypothetical protein